MRASNAVRSISAETFCRSVTISSKIHVMLRARFGAAIWWKSCRRNGFERGTASAAVNRENCVAFGSVHRAAKRPYASV